MKSKHLSQSDIDALLAQPLVAKVATHGRGGEMRITPVWFKQDGADLLMNTLKQTDLARNLARDPQCSVLVDTTDAPNVMALHYWGTAQLEHGADVAGIASIIERYVGGPEQGRAFAQRNLSMGPVVYIRFTPQREVSWDLRAS
jgi:pyridoxamine 5'-phosphate oxidase-like protein